MLNRQQLKGLTTVATGDLVLISATSGSLGVLADVAVGSILVSGGVGVVPGYATDIPIAVTIGSAYIYRAGGTDIPVTDGGTGVGTFALNGVLYGNAGNAIGVTAIGTAGQILTVGASPFVPVWSSTITGTFGGFTASRAVYSDASGNLVVHATLTDTELGYVDGVTSAIQTQINAKLNNIGGKTTVAADDLVIPITHTLVTKTTGEDAEALTLANGTIGQVLSITLGTAGGGIGTLTPTTKSGFSTIAFEHAGEFATLLYVDNTVGWIIIGAFGITHTPIIAQ